MPHPAARRQRMMKGALKQAYRAEKSQARSMAQDIARQRMARRAIRKQGSRIAPIPRAGRAPGRMVGRPVPRFKKIGNVPPGGPRPVTGRPVPRKSKWVRDAAAYSKAAHANIRQNAPNPRAAERRIERSDARASRNVLAAAQKQKVRQARQAIKRSRPGQPGVLR